MPPICFKLKYNGLTRRVTFHDRPSWLELAEKLRSLSNLPLDNVGVSYLDSDNDEITVSSNEELQDLYQSSSQAGDVFKLNILDLSLPRDNTSSPKRNIAGPDFEIIEPGWNSVPPFSLADFLLSKDHLSEGPRAFVEVINSDTSGIEKDLEDLESEDGHSTAQDPSMDKGKQRASTFGAASIASLVDEEPGEKLPIHVLDHGLVSGMSASANPKDQVDPKEQIPLQSTPKVQAQNLSEPKETAPPTEDPPLPTLDDHAATNPSPNLYQDLASFLTMLNNVISSHPELSEGMRKIMNQAGTGEYWRTYSSSISEAAQRFSQHAEEDARLIEADAIRRISNALGNFIRFFSPENADQRASQNGQQEQNAQSSNSTSPFGNFGPRPDTSGPQLGPRPIRSSRGWNPHWYGAPWTRPPSHWPPGPFVPPPPHGPPPPVGPLHLNIPPPPPPPPRRPMPPMPPHYGFAPYAPAPAPPPRTPTSPAAHLQSAAIPVETAFSEAVRNSLNPPPPPQGPVPATEELRAKVEEAKRLYRAQKDAYRQERARRRETEKAVRGEIPVGMQPSTSGSSREPAEVTWATFPQYSPKRAHTHMGHGARPHSYKTEDLNARAQNRIIKKLADMGFTENSHPKLSEKVAGLLPIGDAISKDREDDLVTTVLEDLIPVSPKPTPAASGRNELIPGAWQ